MTDQHPITPSPELIEQWFHDWDWRDDGPAFNEAVVIKAARWGADMELEACCADIHTLYGQYRADWLRLIRRPKPQSLKKQALAVLDDVSDQLDAVHENTIRRALELLDD